MATQSANAYNIYENLALYYIQYASHVSTTPVAIVREDAPLSSSMSKQMPKQYLKLGQGGFLAYKG
jgi:hypothetical protein